MYEEKQGFEVISIGHNGATHLYILLHQIHFDF